MHPDGFSFGDEIANSEDQAVIDQHAIAGAFGAQRLGRERIFRDDAMEADHRFQCAIEIEAEIFRARLYAGRHFPFGQ
jgi:hypothetical protein